MGISSYSSCSIETCYAKSISLHASRHASLPPNPPSCILKTSNGFTEDSTPKTTKTSFGTLPLLQLTINSKAELQEKIEGSPVLPGHPALWFLWKIQEFLVAQEQRFGARDYRVLQEHSLALNSVVYVTLLTPTCVVNMVKLFNWQILCKSIIKENQKPVLIFSTSILCHNPSIQHI